MNDASMFTFLMTRAGRERLSATRNRFECLLWGRGRQNRPPESMLILAAADLLLEKLKRTPDLLFDCARGPGKVGVRFWLPIDVRRRLDAAQAKISGTPSLSSMLAVGCELFCRAVEEDEPVVHLPAFAKAGARQDGGDSGWLYAETHPHVVYRALLKEPRPLTEPEQAMFQAEAERMRVGDVVRFRGRLFGDGRTDTGAKTPRGEWEVRDVTGRFLTAERGANIYASHLFDAEVA